MREPSALTRHLKRRRAVRACRKLDRRAVREEFVLESPRGLGRLRAFAASVSALEQARLQSHSARGRPAPVAAERARTSTR